MLYIAGWCFDEVESIRHVDLVVNGRTEPVIAANMPRYDVYCRFSSHAEARRAFRSGFWGIVTLGTGGDQSARVAVRIWTDEPRDHELGEIQLEHAELAPPSSQPMTAFSERPPVVICMATYNPHPVDFERQIESIRAQTYRNWTCIINDDESNPTSFDMIRKVVGTDERFRIHRNAERLGYYLNFAACLALAPDTVRHVALSDQDDVWHPDKLSTLMDAMQRDGSVLAFSDMRIVTRERHVLHESFWRRGYRNNYTDLGALLAANTVTGAASLFSRAVIETALPFPHVRSAYHDHWLACVALSIGDISYVNRPLYDYVQHGNNVLGHRGRPGPQNPGARNPQNWYFANAIVTMIFARELLARIGRQLPAHKRWALERAATLDSRRGVLWLVNQWRHRPLEVRGPKLLVAAFWRRALSRVPRPPGLALSVTSSALPGVAAHGRPPRGGQ